MEACEGESGGRRLATLKGRFAFIRSQYFKKKREKGEKGVGGTICSPSPTAPNNNPLCIFVNAQRGRECLFKGKRARGAGGSGVPLRRKRRA